MKILTLSSAALLAFFAATFVVPMQNLQAQDIVRMNDDKDIVISGTIVAVERGSFTINTGTAATTTVTTDKMDDAADTSVLLKPGMKVTVTGKLGSGTFRQPVVQATAISGFTEPVVPGTVPAPVP